jgi:hypothetical protein
VHVVTTGRVTDCALVGWSRLEKARSYLRGEEREFRE